MPQEHAETVALFVQFSDRAGWATPLGVFAKAQRHFEEIGWIWPL